jgi:SAM-dependent methyltransferase
VNALRPSPVTLSRQYVKLCERADFEDPDFRAMLSDIHPGLSRTEEVYRKHWEFAMLGLYLKEVGALQEDAEALAVAAGRETIVYWMANHVGRVVATDIYGKGAFGDREAESSMLTAPAAFAPYSYREDHLEVLDMNALMLDFPDGSFDIVYSLSSIEHFGGLRAASQAAREMSRVLRLGGHLVLTTECLVGRHPLDWAPLQFAIRLGTLGRRCPSATLRSRATQVFTAREIERDIVRASGLELVQPLDTHVSAESYENLARPSPNGDVQTETGNVFPHIILQAYGAPWTSAFLALWKPS